MGQHLPPYYTTFLPENFPLTWGKFSSPQCNRQLNFKIFDNGIFLVDFCHTVIGQHNLSLITSNHVALFVAPLSERQLSHITIHTYLSAVSYIFRLREWNDPTSGFTVTKTLQGVQKLSPGESIRPLPITRPLLHRLVQAIPHFTACHYYQLLFKTLFLFTYFACPRAGEIVVSNDPSRVNQMSQIAVFERAGCKVYEINLNSFKHSTGRTPTLTLLPIMTQEFCPVTALDHHIHARGVSDGPLIRHRSGKPLTRTEFADFLHSCLVYCGEQDGKYGTHSFGVGRATQLAADNQADRLYTKQADGKAVHIYSTFAIITSLSLKKHWLTRVTYLRCPLWAARCII